jgi:hypothetical protein
VLFSGGQESDALLDHIIVTSLLQTSNRLPHMYKAANATGWQCAAGKGPVWLVQQGDCMIRGGALICFSEQLELDTMEDGMRHA